MVLLLLMMMMEMQKVIDALEQVRIRRRVREWFVCQSRAYILARNVTILSDIYICHSLNPFGI